MVSLPPFEIKLGLALSLVTPPSKKSPAQVLSSLSLVSLDSRLGRIHCLASGFSNFWIFLFSSTFFQRLAILLVASLTAILVLGAPWFDEAVEVMLELLLDRWPSDIFRGIPLSGDFTAWLLRFVTDLLAIEGMPVVEIFSALEVFISFGCTRFDDLCGVFVGVRSLLWTGDVFAEMVENGFVSLDLVWENLLKILRNVWFFLLNYSENFYLFFKPNFSILRKIFTDQAFNSQNIEKNVVANTYFLCNDFNVWND